LVESYYRRVLVTTTTREPYTFVWDAGRNNRLTRYLSAVLLTSGRPKSELSSLMEQLWVKYVRGLALSLEGARPGYGLPITTFALADMPELVFVCRSCHYISAETVRGICLRCHHACDQVARIEAISLQNNYYRLLASYASDPIMPDPFPLRVYEHTAQISQEEAAKRERRFQDQFLSEEARSPENPVQHGVDILSVTTTMEMGIDIGDLTVVGLHNTPPTVANYQQRAGRAGRRSDGIAEVLTFTRFRSHDQYYYDRMAEIITGQVRIPVLHLNNQVIARRHVNAFLLQAFFAALSYGSSDSTLFDAFGTVDGLLGDNAQRFAQLRTFVQGESSLVAISLDELHNRAFGLLSGSCISRDEVIGWIADLPDSVLEIAENAVGNETLLDLLIEKGLLPRYAFPVDVVALWLEAPTRWNRGEEIQRDLSIALSEYAPGAEVIVDGKVYESIGLYTPFSDSPSYRPTGWYYECPSCRYVLFDDTSDRPKWEACPMCRTAVGSNQLHDIMPAIQPNGFRTDWANVDSEKARKYRGDGQEKAGYASPAQLVAGESADTGNLVLDGRLYMLQRTGDLYVVNRGPKSEPNEPPGFYICPTCGRVLDSPNALHDDPYSGYRCRRGAAASRSVLLHRFNTDIALFGTVLPQGHNARPSTKGGRGVWLSLGTALRQGAAAHLQVDPEELAMGIRPWSQPNQGGFSAEIFLYDTLPNGAGYAREVVEELDAVLERAWDIASNCSGNCSTACYRCLFDYGNQREHPLLDRFLAADMLRYLRNGTMPEPFLSEVASRVMVERMKDFVESRDIELGQDGITGAWYGRIHGNRTVGLVPTCTLRAHDTELAAEIKDIWPVLVSEFDLTRRPFWVWTKLAPILGGQLDRRILDE